MLVFIVVVSALRIATQYKKYHCARCPLGQPAKVFSAWFRRTAYRKVCVNLSKHLGFSRRHRVSGDLLFSELRNSFRAIVLTHFVPRSGLDLVHARTWKASRSSTSSCQDCLFCPLASERSALIRFDAMAGKVATGVYIYIPEAPNVPFFLGTRKKRSNYRFLLDPPKNARPPKKRSTTSPSSIQRKAGLLRFLDLHSFADICARFADICARFAF